METPAPPGSKEPLERKRDRHHHAFAFPSKKRQKLRTENTDKFGRAITDLRISITDRCNYKCVYCRTGNEGALYGDLPFADYLRMARVLVGHGIKKSHHRRRAAAAQRGGEFRPRAGPAAYDPGWCVKDEPLDIALTTNGHLLADLAQPLKDAGLTASPSAWTPSIPTASPASRACPTDTTTCWPASAPRAAPGCGR
jgi:hypothetical protein